MTGLLAPDFCTVLKENTVRQLRRFSDEQEGFCRTEEERRAVRFFADKDCFFPIKQDRLPFINVWTSDETPDERTSGRRTQPSATVTLNLDLAVMFSPAAPQPQISEPRIVTAFRRLDYLKYQVKTALADQDFTDLGFEPGVIGRRTWPSFNLYKDAAGNPELALVSGRISLDVTYCWDLEKPCTLPVDSISVDARLFSALYTYNQEDFCK